MFWIFYITNPSRKVAVKIGNYLIDKKIAACFNVLQITDSVFKWEGKKEHIREWALIAKTTNPSAVEKEVRKVHPYKVPCIIRWKVSANKDYERWLKQS